MPAASGFHIIITFVAVYAHSWPFTATSHSWKKQWWPVLAWGLSAHPQASELLTTPEELIVSTAICRVSEAGWDEYTHCLSHSSVNEERSNCMPGVYKPPFSFNLYNHKPWAVAPHFLKGKRKHFVTILGTWWVLHGLRYIPADQFCHRRAVFNSFISKYAHLLEQTSSCCLTGAKFVRYPKNSTVITCVLNVFLWKGLYSSLLLFAYWLQNQLAHWKCYWFCLLPWHINTGGICRRSYTEQFCCYL